MSKSNRKILLRSCPRCQGDLFPDQEEEDFACLQCGRRFQVAQVLGILQAPRPQLAPAA
jgi:predicted RNA-binding Zn-ribbon protein involved in translation (DUF1610 family)